MVPILIHQRDGQSVHRITLSQGDAHSKFGFSIGVTPHVQIRPGEFKVRI